MKQLSDFLGKHLETHTKLQTQKEKILEILNIFSKAELEKKDIEVKNKTLSIRTTPLEKHSIFVSKQKILDEFKKRDLEILDIK